jgi:hypothetical protein
MWWCPHFTQYPGIYLERLRRTMKDLSHESQCPDQDSNWAPPEYEVVVLPTKL